MLASSNAAATLVRCSPVGPSATTRAPARQPRCRGLRLAAIELRGLATTLLGHADRLGADDASWQTGSTIGAIARQMLDLADHLQHHSLADTAHRVLCEEPIYLAVMLDEAVAAVQASLEPSGRN